MGRGYIGFSSTSKIEGLERSEAGFVFCPHSGAPAVTNGDNDKEEYLDFRK